MKFKCIEVNLDLLFLSYVISGVVVMDLWVCLFDGVVIVEFVFLVMFFIGFCVELLFGIEM